VTNETSSTCRVKSYGRLEAEVQSLEKQVEFYRAELEDAARAERHRACLIVRKYFGECEDTRWAIEELLGDDV
jgi:hypothetical protein